MKSEIYEYFSCRLLQAEEKQKSAYQEKETLEMRYQDEIDLAKVNIDLFVFFYVTW